MVGTSFTPVPEIELSDISSYLEGEQRCLVLAEFSITLQELYSIIGTNRVSCYLVQLSILLFLCFEENSCGHYATECGIMEHEERIVLLL